MNNSPRSKNPRSPVAQKRAFARIDKLGTKYVARLFRTVPIAQCDTGAFDPHFTNLPSARSVERFGIGDHGLLIGAVSPEPTRRRPSDSSTTWALPFSNPSGR